MNLEAAVWAVKLEEVVGYEWEFSWSWRGWHRTERYGLHLIDDGLGFKILLLPLGIAISIRM